MTNSNTDGSESKNFKTSDTAEREKDKDKDKKSVRTGGKTKGGSTKSGKRKSTSSNAVSPADGKPPEKKSNTSKNRQKGKDREGDEDWDRDPPTAVDASAKKKGGDTRYSILRLFYKANWQ